MAEDPLGGGKFEAIAQLVVLRYEYLSAMFGSDAPATARTGLVGLNRAIYLLATRYLDNPVDPDVLKPDVRALRAVGWYEQYLKALINASQFMQRAFGEHLTPRCLLSRTPFPHDALSEWTKRDVAGAVSAAARTFWVRPPTSGFDCEAWPDYAARAPGVGIDQRELDGLSERMGLEPSAYEGDLSNESPGPIYDPAMYREKVRKVVEAHGGNKSRAARELGISRQRVGQLIKESCTKREITPNLQHLFAIKKDKAK